MKKLLVATIASLTLCATSAFAKGPVFAENGNFAIQTNIFAGYAIDGKPVVHIKLTNFQKYVAVCEVKDKASNGAKASFQMKPGHTMWLHDATMPLTFDVKCKVKDT